MHRGEDLQLPGVDKIGHDLAALLDVLCGQFGIGDSDLLDEFVVMGISLALKSAQRFDRRFDILQHRREIAELYFVDRAFDRAADIMAKNNNRLGTRDACREFQTAEDVPIDEISRYASTENITDALIENKLWRHARVDAAEYRRKWRLLGRGILHLGDEVAVGRFARK
jgi:hypothetical protein